MSKRNASNPNWKGGITKIREADDILLLPKKAQEIIRNRLLRQYKKSRCGCWNWTGMVFTSNGRARISVGKNTMTASRVSFVLHKGTTNGLLVLHTCDNVACINPSHLWLGTNQDNMDDMVNKGRSPVGDRNGSRKHPEKLIRGTDHLNHKHPERVQGENNGRALLTAAQVKEIRKSYVPFKRGNRAMLARKYGVAVHVIAYVTHGGWRSVT